MASPPRISAVVTAYQFERFIADAIRSVQSQTRPVREIIVVDNGSTDSTLDIVKDLAGRDPRIRPIDERSARGPAHARNCGLKAATGDVIAFLDGDDLWPETKIMRQMARLEAQPRVDVVTGLTMFVEDIDPKTLRPRPGSRTRANMHINLGARLYRRTVFDQVGLFDTDLRYADDLDLLLRIRDAGLKVAETPEVTLYFRRYPGSHSTNADTRKIQEVATSIGRSVMRRKKLKLPPAPPYRDGLLD